VKGRGKVGKGRGDNVSRVEMKFGGGGARVVRTESEGEAEAERRCMERAREERRGDSLYW